MNKKEAKEKILSQCSIIRGYVSEIPPMIIQLNHLSPDSVKYLKVQFSVFENVLNALKQLGRFENELVDKIEGIYE